MSEEEQSVVSLEQWTRQRQDVQDLAQSVANGTGSSDALLIQTAKLQNMTAGVVDALLNDMGFLHNLMKMSQTQMGNIAQQSFLSLETLKRKGITTPEEVRELYTEIMQKQQEEDTAAEQAARDAVDLADKKDPARIAHYEQLLKQGFTEEEAKVTVWPEDVLAEMNKTVGQNDGAEVLEFPSP